jgi:hypothetical protein
VPESPEDTEVIEVDGVTGAIMLGAAAYIATSPINRPMMNADVAATVVFISKFPPDKLPPETSYCLTLGFTYNESGDSLHNNLAPKIFYEEYSCG